MRTLTVAAVAALSAIAVSEISMCRAAEIKVISANGMREVLAETKAKFAEMRYLEQSIGRTALLAIQPMLHMSHKDLWQLYMLGK